MLAKKFNQLEDDLDSLTDFDKQQMEAGAKSGNINVFLNENPKIKALLIALIEFFIWLPFTRSGIDFGLKMLLLAITTDSKEYQNKN